MQFLQSEPLAASQINIYIYIYIYILNVNIKSVVCPSIHSFVTFVVLNVMFVVDTTTCIPMNM